MRKSSKISSSLIKVLPFVALIACFHTSLKNSATTLINNVNTIELFKLLNRQPRFSSVEMRGVGYDVTMSQSPRENGVEGNVTIGVFPSIKVAQTQFQNLAYRPISEIKTAKIGSDFKCWYSPTESKWKGGSCLLRRDNCVIAFSYKGKLQDMLILARQVDNGLKTGAIAKRGNISVPRLIPSHPKQVPLNSRFKVGFKVRGAFSPLLVNTIDSELPIRESRFSLYERAPEHSGRFTKTLFMSTSGNVVFSEKIQLEAAHFPIPSAKISTLR